MEDNLRKLEYKAMIKNGWSGYNNGFSRSHDENRQIIIRPWSAVGRDRHYMRVELGWKNTTNAYHVSSDQKRKFIPRFTSGAELFRCYGFLAAAQIADAYFNHELIKHRSPNTIDRNVYEPDYLKKDELHSYIHSFTGEQVDWIGQGNFVVQAQMESENEPLDKLFWIRSSAMQNIIVIDEQCHIIPEDSDDVKDWIMPKFSIDQALDLAVMATDLCQPYLPLITANRTTNPELPGMD